MKKNKFSTAFGIILILIGTFALGLYAYVSFDNMEESTKNNGFRVEEASVCNNTMDAIYEGKSDGKLESGEAFSYYYKYALSSDGTYIADYNGTDLEKGTYAFSDGEITFYHREKDTDKMLEDTYTIAGDCSKLSFKLENTNIELVKVK